LVHYKRLGLHWIINEKNKLKATIKHYAQWGGNSPDYGKQAVDFKEFVDVFVAKNTGDRENAPGNHLGSYLLEYNLKTNFGEFTTYHEHPFEDGSGTRLANFPDGVWGIFFVPASKKIISSILYEYIDTTDQSYYADGSGADSYFNHRLYKSGWTYDGNTIGLPFLNPPVNNSSRGHHLGLTTTFKNIDFLFKASIVQSNGTIYNPFDMQQNKIYSFAKATYATEKYGKISLLFGYDYDKRAKDLIGGGLSYSYIF
jgi:hypothetical protein